MSRPKKDEIDKALEGLERSRDSLHNAVMYVAGRRSRRFRHLNDFVRDIDRQFDLLAEAIKAADGKVTDVDA